MTLTKDELEQRRTAARKHGVFAIEARGEAALTDEQKPLLVEIREKVQDRDGILELQRENAAKAVLMAEILTSYVIEEHRAGIPLEEIATFTKLPAFYNSAQRALKSLLDETPKDPDETEHEHIKKVIDASTKSDR